MTNKDYFIAGYKCGQSYIIGDGCDIALDEKDIDYINEKFIQFDDEQRISQLFNIIQDCKIELNKMWGVKDV